MSTIPGFTSHCLTGQNSDASIAVISDDVLQMIFLHVAHTDSYSHAGLLMSCHDVREPLIVLTHICRYWRNLAVNTACLWATIRVKRHTMAAKVQAFLDRSGTSSLQFNVDGWGTNATSLELIAQIVSSHSERLEAFRLTNLHAEDMGILLRHFRHETPRLRKIQLDPYTVTLAVEVDDGLFGGHMPLLREVAFGPVAPLLLQQLQGLTTLELRYQVDLSDERLFSILRRCPGLEVLRVISHSTIRSDRDCLESVIELANLKTLEVVAEQDFILRFLDNITFPPTTGLHVEFLGSTPSGTFQCHSFRTITSRIKRLTLEIRDDLSWDHTVMVMKSKNPACFVTWGWPSFPGVDEYASETSLDPLRFDLMQLDAVQTLNIASLPRDHEIDKRDWARILLLMRNVTSIRLNITGVVDSISVLGPFCQALRATRLNDEVTSTICPELRSFALIYDDKLKDKTLGHMLECFESLGDRSCRLAAFNLMMDTMKKGAYPSPLQARLDNIADKVVVRHKPFRRLIPVSPDDVMTTHRSLL